MAACALFTVTDMTVKTEYGAKRYSPSPGTLVTAIRVSTQLMREGGESVMG